MSKLISVRTPETIINQMQSAYPPKYTAQFRPSYSQHYLHYLHQGWEHKDKPVATLQPSALEMIQVWIGRAEESFFSRVQYEQQQNKNQYPTISHYLRFLLIVGVQHGHPYRPVEKVKDEFGEMFGV